VKYDLDITSGKGGVRSSVLACLETYQTTNRSLW